MSHYMPWWHCLRQHGVAELLCTQHAVLFVGPKSRNVLPAPEGETLQFRCCAPGCLRLVLALPYSHLSEGFVILVPARS